MPNAKAGVFSCNQMGMYRHSSALERRPPLLEASQPHGNGSGRVSQDLTDGVCTRGLKERSGARLTSTGDISTESRAPSHAITI